MITKINNERWVKWLTAGVFSYLLPLTSYLFVSCNDNWNEHFEVQQANEGTLWLSLCQDAEVSNFKRVVESCGYDARLNGSQVFTVFAPSNTQFSTTDADALIARYQEQKQSGVRDEDNEVIKQFLQNHIALFNQSVSSLTNDTITMMNGKYMLLTDKKFGESDIIGKNHFCENGVLFKLSRPQEYDANILEYFRKADDLDSLARFFYSYDIYQFNPNASVAGGEVQNGKIVYLDSVFNLTNSMINEFGYINREDSCYMIVAPTDDVWRSLYHDYQKYFNYSDQTARRDSLRDIMTRKAIVNGTIFNLNQNPLRNDTAWSVTYQKNYRNVTNNEPRYYFYPHPDADGGAFSGAEKVTCSNGVVLKQAHWMIDEHQTFLQQIKIEGESSRYIDSVMYAHEPLGMRQVLSTNPFYGKVSGNYFAEAQPIAAGSTTTIRYSLPNFLSGTGYDIYVVCAPAIAYNEQALPEDTLPCRLNFRIAYMQQDGTLSKEVALKNPLNNTNNYITRPNVMDTVLVASNYQFETCAFGIQNDRPMATLRVASSYISNRESSLYTRVLRIDCIIIKPHEEKLKN